MENFYTNSNSSLAIKIEQAALQGFDSQNMNFETITDECMFSNMKKLDTIYLRTNFTYQLKAISVE